MTRASLLHILDHVSAISESEVRELEQLATAFPYCQTAHLLLAKAAHDRGSMLASQRLRRAATYAADRQLLRQLIEQPALALEAAEAGAQLVPAPVAETFSAAEPAAEYIPSAAAPEEVFETEILEIQENTLNSPKVTASEATADSSAASESDGEAPSELLAPAFAAPIASAAMAEEAAQADILSEADATELAEQAHAEQLTDAAEEETESNQVFENQDVTRLESANPEAVPTTIEEGLLPVAPPIRPPAEVGSSRFEFGLAEASDAPNVAYQLPALAEAGETPGVAGFPAFRADAELGYGMGMGSRLGYCLQLRDEFTQDLPATDFFPPDALLLAHAKLHRPISPPPPSTLELINQFLRNKPRLKAPAARLLPTDEQADLSVRSTAVVPELASESLARIMVKQGKIAKAIEIYERLMVRQPEKKAYFADQIQQLKLSE